MQATGDDGSFPVRSASFPESVLKSSVDTAHLLRPSRGRPIAAAATFIVPVMAVAAALVTWWSVVHIREAPSVTLTGDILWAVATVLLVWMTAALSTNYGVRVEADGLTVFDRTLNRQRLVSDHRTWSEIRSIALRGVLRESVEVKGSGRSLWLDHGQAKVILADPRCPLRRTLDPAVLAELGVEMAKSRNPM